MQQPARRNTGGGGYATTTADTPTQRERDLLGPPCFDDAHYISWKIQMKYRLVFFNPLLLRIVETGFSDADEANPTNPEQTNSHHNAQAINALYCALSDDQLYRVWGLDSAKEIWDALRTMHQDTPVVRELKVKVSREKMRSFALRKRESPNDMYWRLQALVGTMKRYGCKREVTDSYVVRKILCAMAPRYPTMVSTVCERPDFEELTPRGVIDSFIFYDMLQESSGRITGGSATTKVDDTARETAPPALTYGDSEYCFGSSGETPHFDGTHYLSWQRRMKLHLLSMNPLVWRIVETGHVVVDKANPTALEKRNTQYDAQAMYALISTLSGSEYTWVCYYESAKEIWDALHTIHEAVCEPKLDLLRREMDLFALGKHETPNDMYTRLNNLANEMKGLGCKETTDSYVVRKMLHVMTPRNSALVTLIREMPSFEQLTPRDVLATFLLYDMVQKEYKTTSYASPSSSNISLKAKLVLAEEPSDEEHDQDQEMTLLLENFGRMLRQKEYEARRRITNFPDKSKMRKSKRYCYRCGEPDHLVANCPIQWT